MRLSTVPLSAGTISRCATLWGGREAFTSAQMDTVIRAAARLFATERARGRLILDERGRVRAYGFSTFVTAAFAEASLADPQPHVGTRLLLDPSHPRVIVDDD